MTPREFIWWFRRKRKPNPAPHAVYRLRDGTWSGPFPPLPPHGEVPNPDSAVDARSGLTDGLYPEGRER